MLLTRRVLVSSLLFAAYAAAAQDPTWLRHWNEAQKTRPLDPGAEARIAPESEEGVPFLITGLLVGPDGTPLGDTVVHAYHRDAEGYDFGEGDRTTPTWRLQAFARTNARGEFRFVTIRPAPDHMGREAAHVHFTVDSEAYGRQWAPTVFLSDDPLVTAEQRRRSEQRGEFGHVRDVEVEGGMQRLSVKIRLEREADF